MVGLSLGTDDGKAESDGSKVGKYEGSVETLGNSEGIDVAVGD